MTRTEPLTSTAAAGVLPEPGDAADFPATAASADDLIARMADRQIDDLLGEDLADLPPRDAAADAAMGLATQAASERRELSDGLKSVARTDVKRDAATTPTPPSASPFATDAPSIVAASLGLAAEPPAVAEVDVPVESPSTAPQFEPPRQAASVAPEVHDAGPAEASDADAVARELAADVALLSRPLPMTESSAVARPAGEPAVALGAPSWRRLVDALLAVPLWLLATINAPVRPLSDRGREIMGGVAIVTLVNAVGVIAYLRFFAPRH